MTEDDIVSIISAGDISREAATGIVRSYGNLRVIAALEEARKSIPDRLLSAQEVEIEMYVKSCIDKLDQMIALIIEPQGKE